MLTAARSETDVRRAITHGASDYLTKPFRPDKLILRVDRLLQSGRDSRVDRDRQVA
jgi:DNA-binding response OmpR family regulator